MGNTRRSTNKTTKNKGVKKINNYNILYAILIIGGLLTVLLNVGWSDPDSYAFYNRSCLNAKDFTTPELSKQIFSKINCNIINWKATQIILGIITLLTFFISSKIIFEKENNDSFYLYLYSSSITMFLLNFEDDNISLPALIILMAILYKTKKEELGKKILFGIPIFFITIFFGEKIWSGTFLIMGIFLLWYFAPKISTITIPLYYIFFPNNANEYHVSEETIGISSIINNPLSAISAYFILDDWKKKTIKHDEIIILGIFFILSIIKPKWGIYFAIINTWYLWPKIKNFLIQKKLLDFYKIIGVGIFYFGCIWITFNAGPNPEMWVLINQAVDYQKQGSVLYNDWGLGRYISFLEGKPSIEGGGGQQFFPDSNYIWLGEKKDNCFTLNSSGKLFLQKC